MEDRDVTSDPRAVMRVTLSYRRIFYLLSDAICYTYSMSRYDKFLSLKTHPWFHRSFLKLNQAELSFAAEFIKSSESDDSNKFIHKAVRLFLDVKDKPRHWKEIEELLVATNSVGE